MHKLMMKIKQSVKKVIKGILLLIYRCMRMLPINKTRIIIESNLGRNFTGNPKAIYEAMVDYGFDKKYEINIILEHTKTPIKGSAKKIKRSRLRYFYVLATSGIWISDSRFPAFAVKREKCHYIQTWHGTPLKKLALDMEDVFMAGETDIDTYKKSFVANTSTWDYLISQNHYSTEIFKRAFAFHKHVVEIGYPRNDCLVNDNNEDKIEQKKKKMGIPLNKKVLLYAPTWRDDEFYGLGKYKFNPQLDFDLLKKELQEDTIIIVKYHYLIMDKVDWSPYKGFIYAFDMTYDISEMYLVADMLITDYSSVMFDYSILRRPMLFYCYDLEKYEHELRGFYFDFITKAPGPIVKTTTELVEAIRNYDSKVYAEKYDSFCNEFNHADDGNASSKIVALVEELIEE